MGDIKLIKKLWTLWEALAEAGEIKMSYKFHNSYLEIEKEIKNVEIPNQISDYEVDRVIRMILSVDTEQNEYDVRYQQMELVKEWLEYNK